MTTKSWLEEKFKEHSRLKVVFEKLNGEMRTMFCTQDPELIPDEYAPNGKGPVVLPATIRVFDLENMGWRSFRVDSVKSVEWSL